MSKRKKTSKISALQARPGNVIARGLPWRVPAAAAIIVVVAFIAYLPSLSGGFIWDDDILVLQNRIIKFSDGLYRLWFTTDSPDYWPVTNSTFWIEWRLWGANPRGYRATNLILHIAEALLLWIILKKMSIPGASWAAIVFAVHPVNVESVAWIAQRKNTMAMLFFLISIFWYLKSEIKTPAASAGAKRGNTTLPLLQSISVWYWLSLAAFVLAMLSKGSAAVLPVLLLGIIWWLRPSEKKGTGTSLDHGLSGKVTYSSEPVPLFSQSLTRWDLIKTAPFFLVAAVFTVVNMWFQTHGAEVVIRTAGFTERLLGAGGVAWFYLYKALLPFDLAFIYPQWHIDAGNPLWWAPLLSASIVTAALLWYRESWGRPFLFAWGFFCVALMPVLGFMDVGFMKYSLVADHYQHIAIIGVIVLVAAGYSAWRRRLHGGAHRAAIIMAVAAVGVLALLTWRQSRLYTDEITLYLDTLEKNPECWVAQNNLGSTLSDMGRLQEAVEHFRQAVRIKPDYFQARNNLGNELMKTGHSQEAFEQFQQVLRLKPDYPEVHNNLGNFFAGTGRLQEGIEQLQQAVRLRLDYIEAHNNLGAALVKADRFQEAIESYDNALQLNPDFYPAHYNLGIILAQTGRVQEAIEHYHQVIRLNPDFADAYNNLGAALVQANRPQEAFEYYRQALRLKPDFTHVYYNLSLAYAKMHRSKEAVAAAQKGMELARLRGQTAIGRQFEDLLKSYGTATSNQ